MAGKVCANCGKATHGREWDVRAFYTRKRFATCGFDCHMAFSQAYHAHEESDDPAFVHARERYDEREMYRSERQAEFDAGII